MKFYLRSQKSLDSESKRLKKIINKYHFKLHEDDIGNIFAKSHGFANFKCMRFYHDPRNIEIKFSTNKIQERVYVDELSEVLYDLFNFQKRAIIENYLMGIQKRYCECGSATETSQISKAMDDFFAKRAIIINPFKAKIANNKILTKLNWNQPINFKANKDAELIEIYAKYPLFHASENGGLFILRKTVAEKVIAAAKDILKLLGERSKQEEIDEINNRLAIINLNNDYFIDDNVVNFSPLNSESPQKLFAFISEMIDKNCESESIEDIKGLYYAFFDALGRINGNSDRALISLSQDKLIPTMNNIVDMALDDKMPANNLLLQYLKSLPGFSFVDAAFKRPLAKSAYSAHENNLGKLPQYKSLINERLCNKYFTLPSIVDCLKAKKIIIAITDEEDTDNQKSNVLKNFLIWNYLKTAEDAALNNELYNRAVVIDNHSGFNAFNNYKCCSIIFGEINNQISHTHLMNL